MTKETMKGEDAVGASAGLQSDDSSWVLELATDVATPEPTPILPADLPRVEGFREGGGADECAGTGGGAGATLPPPTLPAASPAGVPEDDDDGFDAELALDVELESMPMTDFRDDGSFDVEMATDVEMPAPMPSRLMPGRAPAPTSLPGAFCSGPTGRPASNTATDGEETDARGLTPPPVGPATDENNEPFGAHALLPERRPSALTTTSASVSVRNTQEVIEGVITPSGTKGKQAKCSRKQTLCLIGGAILVAAAIIVGVVVGTAGNRKSARNQEGGTAADEPQETDLQEAPSSSQYSDRYLDLRDVILAAITDPAKSERTALSLRNASSPQGRALTWLADEDALQVDPAIDSGSTTQAVQRFALAVVYYATGGQEWINQDGFLTPEHECDWNVVEDDPTAYEFFNHVGTKCEGRAPRDNTSVTHLWLANNHLVGTVPEELVLLTFMTSLALDANFLTGTVPVSAFPPGLEFLWLGENGLTGNVPAELALFDLKELWLVDNDLTGTVPKELSDLSNLEDLALDGNDLDGIIPTELGKLDKLRSLGLSWNQLTGGIPGELGGLASLHYLFLDMNRLTGSVPESVCDLKESDDYGDFVFMAGSEGGRTNNLECSCCAAPGNRTECSAGSLCANDGAFCNFALDGGESGFCEPCLEAHMFEEDVGDVICNFMGLPMAGAQDCRDKCVY